MSATLIAAQKGQPLTVLFEVYDTNFALMTGQAALVTKTLRDEDGAGAETVTVTEQATAGYYKATFTPTKGGAPPKTYWIKIVESGAGQAGRQIDWLVQSYDVLPAYAGATSGLTTLAAVKEQLKLSGSGDDAFLTNLITRVSASIKTITRRSLTQTTVTEVHDGKRRSWLKLRDWPVISFTSLHEDPDQSWTAASLIASADYVVDTRRGYVTMKSGVTFLRYPQSIRAIYVAGYATIPADLESRVIQTIIEDWRTRSNEGLASKTLGDGSMVFFPSGDRFKALQSRFAPYINYRVAS